MSQSPSPTQRPQGPRSVLRAVAGVVCGWAMLVALPVSPLALDGADLLAASGHSELAAEHYERIGAWNPLVEVRSSARLRAARLSLDELQDVSRARRQLEALLSDRGFGEEAARAWERLGRLQEAEGDLAAAAQSYQHAYRSHRVSVQARRRLILAARTRAEAGHRQISSKLWSRLAKRYPEERARSLVGQARLSLLAGDAQEALNLYERAIPHANDPDLRRVARLGAATCLERLGDLDEALAEIDGAFLPDTVAERRRQGMQSRRAELGTL